MMAGGTLARVDDRDDGLDPLVFRRDKRPTTEQREDYLALLLTGHTHVEAARKVGSTGTAFRALCKRDPDFKAQRDEAEEWRKEAFPDRIRDSLMTRAFDELDSKSWEALKFVAETYLPELEYKRTKSTRTEGTLTHLLQVSPEALALMPDEKLDALIELLKELREVDTQARPLEIVA